MNITRTMLVALLALAAAFAVGTIATSGADGRGPAPVANRVVGR